jgi:membrane protein YdbS with pleckstrin-like domain
MTVLFRILALVLACVAAGLAIVAHRRAAGSTATQWSARGSLLLSLAIVVGTVPVLAFPSSQWLTLAGSLVSLALTGASLLLIRRLRHRGRRSSSHHELPNVR